MLNADAAIRAEAYRLTISEGAIPSVLELSTSLGRELDEIQSALGRLGEAHTLAVGPDGEILMAHPFSAVPTDYPVTTSDGRSYWANCAWDVFGILALLDTDGSSQTSCADCGDPLAMAVEARSPVGSGVIQFVVPVRSFWEDVGFT